MKKALLFFLFPITVLGQPCTTNILLDFDAGSDGASITLALLTNSTHGAGFSFATNGAGIGGMIFSSDGQKDLIKFDNICNFGTFYGNGSVGLRCETTNDASIKFTSSLSSMKASAGWWVKGTLPSETLVFIDSFLIQEDGNLSGPGAYANASWESGAGGYRFGLETGGVDHPESLGRYATNVWWWITMLYDAAGSNKLSIYNSNLVFQESLTSAGHRTGATNANHLIFGNCILGQSTPGKYMYFDNIIFDFASGIFPLLPSTSQQIMGGPATINGNVTIR